MTNFATQQLTLEIGGSQLRFHGDGGLLLQPPAWDYPDFIAAPSSNERPADIDIAVSTDTPPVEPLMQPRFDTGDAWRLSGVGDKRRIEMIPRNGNSSPLWCADTDCHYSRIRLYCGDSLLQTDAAGTRVRHLVQYPLDQILLVQHLLGARKGLLVHAAGAVHEVAGTPARGVVFAGISGAGKSTLTRQLKDAPGWRFLSDDRIILRLQRGRVDMYGTPWPGDAHVALNQHAPLKALCFLRQSDHSRLQPIASGKALDRLLPVASIPWFDRSIVNKALALCEQLLTDVPVFELHFQRRDTQLAALLETLPL